MYRGSRLSAIELPASYLTDLSAISMDFWRFLVDPVRGQEGFHLGLQGNSLGIAGTPANNLIGSHGWISKSNAMRAMRSANKRA